MLPHLFRTQELDRGGTLEHRVSCAVHNAHPAFTEFLLERILAQPTHVADLLPQAKDDTRRERAGRDD